jgi:hypothetical protein
MLGAHAGPEFGSLPLLVALSPEALPRAAHIQRSVSLPVLLFTLGAAVLAAVVFGPGAGWRAARSRRVRSHPET